MGWLICILCAAKFGVLFVYHHLLVPLLLCVLNVICEWQIFGACRDVCIIKFITLDQRLGVRSFYLYLTVTVLMDV